MFGLDSHNSEVNCKESLKAMNLEFFSSRI